MNGQFHIAATHDRIWLPPLPFDFFYPLTRITMSASGYEPHHFEPDRQGNYTDPQQSPDGSTFYLKHE